MMESAFLKGIGKATGAAATTTIIGIVTATAIGATMTVIGTGIETATGIATNQTRFKT